MLEWREDVLVSFAGETYSSVIVLDELSRHIELYEEVRLVELDHMDWMKI